MKKLAMVENLKKGDVITLIQVSTYWDSETQEERQEIRKHQFEIVRNNPKTYGCKYISGAYAGMGFNLVKGYDLTQCAPLKTYYLNSAPVHN